MQQNKHKTVNRHLYKHINSLFITCLHRIFIITGIDLLRCMSTACGKQGVKHVFHGLNSISGPKTFCSFTIERVFQSRIRKILLWRVYPCSEIDRTMVLFCFLSKVMKGSKKEKKTGQTRNARRKSRRDERSTLRYNGTYHQSFSITQKKKKSVQCQSHLPRAQIF